MDSSPKKSTHKASAVQAMPVASLAASAQRPVSSARPVPMRILATAGILLGFATGLTLNFLSQPEGRALVVKAQLALTRGAHTNQSVALNETAPVFVAED